MHPPRQVDRLCAAHQHLLGIAAAQGAGTAERTVIDHGYRAARFADASRRHLCGRAGAYNEEVIRIHGSSSADSAAVESEDDRAEAKDQRRDHHVIGLGEPAGETDPPEHDNKQGHRATDGGETAPMALVVISVLSRMAASALRRRRIARIRRGCRERVHIRPCVVESHDCGLILVGH